MIVKRLQETYNRTMQTWFTPIRLLVIFLQVLALLATLFWSEFRLLESLQVLSKLILIYATLFATGTLLTRFGLPDSSRPEHRVITALILFLLFIPLLSWWVFVLLGVVTEIAQRFLRTPSGPLFNPAAMGTLIASFIGFTPDWWGTNFSPRFELFGETASIALFFTLPFAGYVAYRYRKHHLVVAALIAISIAYPLIIGQNPLFLIINGTLAFFLLVMAVEPKTSPALMKEQWVYGIILGLMFVFALKFHFIEAYVGALLVANLYQQHKHISLWFKKGTPASPIAPSLES